MHELEEKAKDKIFEFVDSLNSESLTIFLEIDAILSDEAKVTELGKMVINRVKDRLEKLLN